MCALRGRIHGNFRFFQEQNFPIIHFACPLLLFSYALGDTAYSQEHLKTMVYAKFGGQTKCIMGNSKIENAYCFSSRTSVVVSAETLVQRFKRLFIAGKSWMRQAKKDYVDFGSIFHEV